MYYNYTEEEKLFLHITHSLLEEGYDVEEIVEFLSSQDEEYVESVLSSISLSESVDMQNVELVNICDTLYEVKGKIAQSAWNWAKNLAQKIRAGLKGGRPLQGPAQNTKVLPGTASKTANTTAKVTQTVKNAPSKVAQTVKNLPRGTKVAGAVLAGGLAAGLLTPPPPGDVASSDTDDSKTGNQDDNTTGNGDNTTGNDDKTGNQNGGKDTPTTGINKAGRYWWQTYKRRPNLDQSVALRDYKNIRAHVEMVADYLINEGHADTFEEAEYIMNQLDEDYINHILNTIG